MGDVFLKMLGVDAARVPEGAHTEFFWSHAPRSWTIFILLAIALALVWTVYYLYRREAATTPRALRLGLATLRAATLVILLTVFMGPALGVMQSRTLRPYVVLLLDESLSMSIRDRYRDDALRGRVARVLGQGVEVLEAHPPSRAELADALLRKDSGRFIRELLRKGQLAVLSFSNTVKVREALGEQESRGAGEHGSREAGEQGSRRAGDLRAFGSPLIPSGPATNIAKGLREALRTVAGHPVAGIILVSDGQNTEGDDPLAVVEAAVQFQAPVFTLGIGDPGEPRNVKVAEVWAPDSVFREDPFVIQARIEGRGLGAVEVAVELLERPAESGASGKDEGGTPIATKTVRLRGDSDTQSVTFEHKPQTAGDFTYVVRVAPLPDEQFSEDNLKSVAVKVLSEQARVLLVAGAPIWEYRMIRTLLTRDKTINVSCWLQSMDFGLRQEGDTVIEKLPDSVEELFKYDALVLLDPDPREFNEAWVEAVKRFVGDHGGGLLWMAGPKYTARFLGALKTRGVAELLPVIVDKAEESRTELLGLSYTQEWPLRVTADGMDHAILALDKDPQVNRAIWEALPGVFWSYPVLGAKPATQTLLQHSDPRLQHKGKPRPLLVTGLFGPGRTVFMGFDGSWRWRKLGERYFDQFWIQAVRFVIEGRLMGSQKRGRLTTDREVYALGDRIVITANLFDSSFAPLKDATVPAALKRQGAAPVELELKAVAGQSGQYEASTFATQTGLNRLTVHLSQDKDGLKPLVSKQFTVEFPRVEFADPRLNKALLMELAQRGGGKYFEVDEAANIASALPDRSQTIVVRGKPIELWDTGRLLLLLALLLSAEWALRRQYRMM